MYFEVFLWVDVPHIVVKGITHFVISLRSSFNLNLAQMKITLSGFSHLSGKLIFIITQNRKEGLNWPLVTKDDLI